MACKQHPNTFEVVKPKLYSVTYEYQLYCDRKWYKNLIMNITFMLYPLLCMLFLYLSDRIGRKSILLIIGPIGILGMSVGLIFDNLVAITIFMIFMYMFMATFYINFNVYLNEILINPWRSKFSGLNRIFSVIGHYSRVLI